MADYNSSYTGNQIDDAVGKAHTHSNKSVLDATTASFTSEDKSKLDGIAAGAEANVQADWNESDNTKDGYIKSKPSIPTATSQLSNDSGFVTGTGITSIVELTQAQYDALGSKPNTTMYVVVG